MVICCAAADADAIRPVVEDLEGEGHHVVMLEGVEAEPEALAPAVERLHGEGLYVLCRSKALPRTAVDELRDILLANHVPFGRTLTVASTRPRDLRERIGTSLKRLATNQAQRLARVPPPKPTPPAPAEDAPTQRATPRVPRKTKLGISPPKPPPPPPPKPKAKAKASAKPEVSPPKPEADAGAQAPVEVPRDDSPPAAPIEVARTDSEPPARLTPAIEPEPDLASLGDNLLSKPILIRPSELDDLDTPDDEPPPAGLEEAPTETRLPPVRTGNTTVSPVIPPSTLAAIRTGDTALVDRDALLAAGLAAETPAAPSNQPAVAEEEPSNPPWLWIAVGAGALALVGVIALAAGGDDDDAPSEVAQADTPAPAQQDPLDEVAPEATPDEEPPAGEPDDAPAPDGPTRIGHALRNRDVRSLDVLLVSNTEGPLSWEAAKEHCGGLDLAGLGAWRLPEVGELMSLTGARMTASGYYWTSTPADTFGDAPLVWHARRSRVVTRSRDNLVLCVRGGGSGAG